MPSTPRGPKAAKAAGPVIRVYPAISARAFQHPADRAATKALGAIPGLDVVVRKLIELGYERTMRQADLAGSIRIGDGQLPDISARWEQVSQALDLGTPPSLFVGQSPNVNAYAVGSKNPYVVLSSRLVELTDVGEQSVVLAHEAGHVLAEHTLYRTILRLLTNLGTTVVPLAGIPLTAIRLSMLEWFRAAELSCDRAAAIVVGDPEVVCRTLMVLGGGLPSSRLDVASFLRQVEEYEEWDDGPDRLRRFLTQLGQTHSFPVRRAAELLKWVRSGDYDRIVAGEYLTCDRAPSTAEVSGDAVSFYADRFRDMFNTAGESVSSMGKRFTHWLRGDTDS